MNLKEYEDSFNMVIAINDPSFNWKDNPYISANFYEYLDDNSFQSPGESEFIKSKNVELAYCNGGDQDLSK